MLIRCYLEHGKGRKVSIYLFVQIYLKSAGVECAIWAMQSPSGLFQCII